jgi:hypothetical protein
MGGADHRPIVSMDESGNTGENLLDSVQPVFALAGVSLEEDAAEHVIRAALNHTQMTELKFAALRRSAPGRRNILSVIDDVALTVENVAVAVAHKPWMLAAKLVDELVEPRMLAAGRQIEWYASSEHVRMADRLYARRHVRWVMHGPIFSSLSCRLCGITTTGAVRRSWLLCIEPGSSAATTTSMRFWS